MKAQGLEFKRSFWLSAYIAKKTYPQGWFFLIKPRTFMNNSGLCVKKTLEKYKVPRSDILIIYDDVDLPLGLIRFRARGSSAGHRGMASIKRELGSEEINRLRVGIGGIETEELSDYVLSDFSSSETEILADVIQVAVSATWDWVDKGIDFTMRKYNRRGG